MAERDLGHVISEAERLFRRNKLTRARFWQLYNEAMDITGDDEEALSFLMSMADDAWFEWRVTRR
jgi:hypothetical protein